MKFKRALRGYDPAWVTNTINTLTADYKQNIEQLEESLASIKRDISAAQQEIAAITREIDGYRQAEDEMAKHLLKGHLNAAKQVYEASEKARQFENRKMETISLHEMKNTELKNILARLSEELQSKVEEYRIILELFSINKGDNQDGGKIHGLEPKTGK